MLDWSITNNAPRGYALEDIIGFVSLMLNEHNPKSAAEQLNDGYQHGGGWTPFKGFTLDDQNNLKYPGDPKMKPWAFAKLRDELICVYESAWFAVIQPDRSFEVCRMD